MNPLNADPRRILIVRPSALGDVARSVPTLVSLKRAFPEAQIDWLVRLGFEDAIRHHPDLHEPILFDRRHWWRSFAMMDRLRRRRYDRVYDFQGLARSGAFTLATFAPYRVGMKQSRELARMGYNVVHDVGRFTHVVDRMIGLLEADGITPQRDMRLYTGSADRAWAKRIFDDHTIGDQPYAVIAPTAGWASKRWPIERFTEIAHDLSRFDIRHIIVVGARNELEQARPLIESTGGPRVVNLVGATTVGQLMAIIERCTLAICNDSAALHMAVGFARRAIGLYGLTDPQRDGPYRYDLAVVKAPITETIRHKQSHIGPQYIARITVDDVHAALDRVIAAPPPLAVHPASAAHD